MLCSSFMPLSVRRNRDTMHSESRIAVVGAGVFGLSTALYLSKRGYKNVTVYDYQPYDENAYSPAMGCDSASADVNKIYRCSYGSETEYQDLAFSGRPIWEEWNRMIASTPAKDLPKGLTPETDIFVPCGFLRLSNGEQLSDYDKECLVYLEKAGLRHHQHVLKDASDIKRLSQKETQDPKTNWTDKVKIFSHFQGGKLDGFFDTSAGFTYADKACVWARHLCEKGGVRFVLGPKTGKVTELIIAKSGGARGFRTADGKEHQADVTIVACGGWTPSIIPEAEGILETTAGSVITIQLPKDRQDLWEKFSPEHFPVWSYGLTGHDSPEYGGFYGFPRTKDGKVKIGYRGRKWTNYQTHPRTGKRLSVPRTKYTETKATNLPTKAITNLKRAVGGLIPDLAEVGITDTRMCWYIDSWDNSFIIDYVPGYSNTLFVASGGSGHGFKFLPVLGEHVVNALEGKKDQFTPLWKWRRPEAGVHANGLEEGEFSGRNLDSLEIATEQDWKWSQQSRAML